jgi:hypothetical protein
VNKQYELMASPLKDGYVGLENSPVLLAAQKALVKRDVSLLMWLTVSQILD